MAERNKAPLSLAHWPYNPLSRKDRNGKGGGGKELKKRPAWYEFGVNGLRVSRPKSRTVRNGGYNRAG